MNQNEDKSSRDALVELVQLLFKSDAKNISSKSNDTLLQEGVSEIIRMHER